MPIISVRQAVILCTFLFPAILSLSGCGSFMDIRQWHNKEPSLYEKFMTARKECKTKAEFFCPSPRTDYCPYDVYEKRRFYIQNCMYEKGWDDPYNMLTYRYQK